MRLVVYQRRGEYYAGRFATNGDVQFPEDVSVTLTFEGDHPNALDKAAKAEARRLKIKFVNNLDK
jgi:hypothetical protein